MSVPPSAWWWKTATALSMVAALLAIAMNNNDIDRVCSTVQRQLDRNAATVERGLDGLLLIQDDPLAAKARNVPASAYYAEHPQELAAAITRSRDELRIYHVNAC